MPSQDSLVAIVAFGDAPRSIVSKGKYETTVNTSSVSKGMSLFNDSYLLPLFVLSILWLLLSLFAVTELVSVSSEVGVAVTLRMINVTANVMQL